MIENSRKPEQSKLKAWKQTQMELAEFQVLSESGKNGFARRKLWVRQTKPQLENSWLMETAMAILKGM